MKFFRASFCAIQVLIVGVVCAGTKEPITLKGVPFDVPNKRDQIIQDCIESSANLVEEFKRRYNLCEISSHRAHEDYSTIYLANYGNIRIDDQHVLYARINRTANSLVEVFVRGTPEEMILLASLLEDKYGPAQRSSETLQDKYGRNVTNHVFTWEDSKGTVARVETAYLDFVKKLDDGALTVRSKEYLKFVAQQEAEEERKIEKRLNEMRDNL